MLACSPLLSNINYRIQWYNVVVENFKNWNNFNLTYFIIFLQISIIYWILHMRFAWNLPTLHIIHSWILWVVRWLPDWCQPSRLLYLVSQCYSVPGHSMVSRTDLEEIITPGERERDRDREKETETEREREKCHKTVRDQRSTRLQLSSSDCLLSPGCLAQLLKFNTDISVGLNIDQHDQITTSLSDF